jgi:hypothetical protein
MGPPEVYDGQSELPGVPLGLAAPLATPERHGRRLLDNACTVKKLLHYTHRSVSISHSHACALHEVIAGCAARSGGKRAVALMRRTSVNAYLATRPRRPAQSRPVFPAVASRINALQTLGGQTHDHYS